MDREVIILVHAEAHAARSAVFESAGDDAVGMAIDDMASVSSAVSTQNGGSMP
jgi:hypothetical protein